MPRRRSPQPPGFSPGGVVASPEQLSYYLGSLTPGVGAGAGAAAAAASPAADPMAGLYGYTTAAAAYGTPGEQGGYRGAGCRTVPAGSRGSACLAGCWVLSPCGGTASLQASSSLKPQESDQTVLVACCLSFPLLADQSATGTLPVGTPPPAYRMTWVGVAGARCTTASAFALCTCTHHAFLFT